MRKRILAIFLCLILTLSLAAAVAAEDFTVPLPPGSNFLPPNRPEQPEPDDEDRIVTLQIPITKVVELGGNTAPKQTTFSFYAFPSDPSYGRYEAGGTGLWDVQNCTVTVNGAGTFSCVMTIQIDRRDFFALLPRKRMLHPSLKQSSVRCAKQQSWSEFTGSKTPRLRVTASASFLMSGRCHPDRRSRCFSPTGIRIAAERPFSGRMLPSNRRRRKRISAASDKSFAHWSFRFTTPAPARTARKIAAFPRHGRTAARFSQTTTAARAHRASFTSW